MFNHLLPVGFRGNEIGQPIRLILHWSTSVVCCWILPSEQPRTSIETSEFKEKSNQSILHNQYQYLNINSHPSIPYPSKPHMQTCRPQARRQPPEQQLLGVKQVPPLGLQARGPSTSSSNVQTLNVPKALMLQISGTSQSLLLVQDAPYSLSMGDRHCWWSRLKRPKRQRSPSIHWLGSLHMAPSCPGTGKRMPWGSGLGWASVVGRRAAKVTATALIACILRMWELKLGLKRLDERWGGRCGRYLSPGDVRLFIVQSLPFFLEGI